MHLQLRYTESIDMWGAGIILYTMLIGEPPFNEPSIPKLVEKLKHAEYDRSTPEWRILSPEA